MGVERSWILLLLLVALGAILFFKSRSHYVFPSLASIPRDGRSLLFCFALMASRILLLLLLVLLSAGVRFSSGQRLKHGYGADIVFLLDESLSMEDPFNSQQEVAVLDDHSQEQESKFQAAKAAIVRFMETRGNGQDRYGLTVFGQSAVTVLPLSMNHQLFLECLEAQECVLSSTYLHYPVASGLNELMRSRARSRVIVMVSDGEGFLEDEKYGFSEIIKKHGIRFYWVSLGTDWAVELPELLEKIGPLGRRMEVVNSLELEKGFEEIHHLERSLVAYRPSPKRVDSTAFVYFALLLMAMTWIFHSLFVYRRSG